MGNPSIEAMQHIEEIRTKKFSIGKKVPNPLTLDLHHAVASLSAELYQKDIHFLMELIQNAEDNEYKEGVEPTLEFVLTEKDITGTGAPATLLVFNNEVGFSRENIDSICSIGRSTKKGKRRQGFIGEKGIGFKSVFLVSSQPHIFSNGYHVKFREEPNQVCGIGYIVPEWVWGADLLVLTVQAVYGHGKDLPTTTFLLPLKRDKVEAVRAQLLELHPEILLFLSKIKRLYVRGCDPQKADDVSTLSIFSETEHTELRSKTANSRVVQLSVKEKMCDTEQLCKYYLWREDFPVKPGNRVEIRMDVEKWALLEKREIMNFLEFDSDSIDTIPLLKYTDRKGSPALCTIKTTEEELKIRYAMGLELHTWLSKCNMEFGCPDNVYFLPNKTLEAVLNHQKSHPPKRRYRKKNHMESSSVCNWLNRSAGVKSLSAYDYAFLLLNHVSKKESNVAVRLSNFLYLAHKEGFLTEYEISDLCGRIPIVDGSDKVRVQRTVTLVPSSGSKWAKFSFFLGKSTPEKELLHFVGEYSKAMDLPDLCPPDVVLQIASHELSSEQAFLLLDWIRLLRTKNSSIPKNFIESIENGKWMKTFSGYKSPREVIFPDETGKALFDLMKHVLEDVAILDQEFYMNKIKLYQDELKFLGVRLGSENIGKLVTTRFLSLASSGMSKESTYSLLTFISFSRGRSMVDNGWLAVMKEKKWLKKLRGYNPPNGSILLLQSEIEVENCSKVTNLPIVDEAFYGSRLGSFLSELRLLGVTYDADVVQRLVAENVNLTSNLSSMTGGCGLLILKCVRWLGSGAAGLINRIKCHPWVKTTLGFKSPSETVLPDPKWVSLLSTLQVPAIDELYYDNAIRQFVDELNALGVVVDNTGTTVMIAARFKSLLSSSSLDPATVMALLRCIREMNLTMSLQHSELQWLLSEKWLKTRHGFKTPDESIIFSSKWGQLMLFVDLPLIDDVYYGTGIYKFRDELEKLGAITDFERGSPLVAKGLHSPIEAELLDADGIRSLLECIKSLMSRSLDDPLVGDFLKNIANSRCLKTTNGYKAPEDCILFDSSWECILNRLDAPSIDEAFYRTDISAYKNQLRDVGVKVDPQDVCSLLSGHLLSLTDTASITRIYSFLNKFQWSPKVLNKCNSQVWIPEPKSKAGAWAKSQCCVLHDKKNLFGSCLFSLDKYYSKELLPIFSSAFGVPENPSIKDYLLLWDIWASMNNSIVTVEKCSSFWKCIVDNWNPHIEETLKQNLTKVPATMSMSGQIYLIRKEEAFIADDLQLKTIFSSFDKAPLFVWFPNSSSSVPHRRLLEIYESLGVRKISASVKCTVKGMLSSEHWEKVEQNNGLIGRSLTKIVLAFLAGPELNMPFKERLEAAKSMSVLTVYKTDKPIKVCYQLMPCASTTVEVEKLKLVLWEKDSKRLFIDKSGYDGGKSDLEFVTSFANELAQGLLAQARPAAAHALSRIIQMAYIYGFNENEVEFLLMTENLELFVEDKKFLDEAYPVSQKRTTA
ncbi:hypothetical protein ABKV19_016972 [Rosa sericea]